LNRQKNIIIVADKVWFGHVQFPGHVFDRTIIVLFIFTQVIRAFCGGLPFVEELHVFHMRGKDSLPITRVVTHPETSDAGWCSADAHVIVTTAPNHALISFYYHIIILIFLHVFTYTWTVVFYYFLPSVQKGDDRHLNKKYLRII